MQKSRISVHTNVTLFLRRAIVPVDEFRNPDNQASLRMSWKIPGIAKKKRIAILLKTQLIKEDNDAFES